MLACFDSFLLDKSVYGIVAVLSNPREPQYEFGELASVGRRRTGEAQFH